MTGTAATLNAGDILGGGAGTDVLALYGSGIFRVDQLASFTGFESITLNNFDSVHASLYLGSQSVAVTGYGSGEEFVILGSGAVTFQAGSGSSYSGRSYIHSDSASNWSRGVLNPPSLIENVAPSPSARRGLPRLFSYL